MDGFKIIALIVSAVAALFFIAALTFYVRGRRANYEYPRRDAWDVAAASLTLGLVFLVAAGIIWFIAFGGVK